MKNLVWFSALLILTLGCSVSGDKQTKPCCAINGPKVGSLAEANLVQFIRDELQRNNLSDLYIGIPKVESNFKINSEFEGCAGIWQLKKSTAKSLGLKIDEKTDERFDVKKSTKAAIKYLKYLEARFHSVDLVLAAYNWGESRVARALKHNKPLPKKVLNYVAKVKKAAEAMV